jgi:phosphoribosyl 1,2-cyclic phosphodiesterase
MSLYIASLNSGSNGNCYYVGNGKEAILVDAGISCKETEKRMARLGLSLKNVKAIFISHEHTDHIKGLSILSKKYNLPVYISSKTLHFSRLDLENELIRSFEADTTVRINNLAITAFSKFHDAVEPHSFVVEGGGVTVGVFTDIGNVCDNLRYRFSRCHAAFLEANYDSTMLEYGKYPIHLKNRIRGGKGHLSNEQALGLFKQHRHSKLRYLLLSHLSKENNSPDIVSEMFSRHADGVEIIIASRYRESEVYHVHNITSAVDPYHYQKAQQVSLF